MIETIEREVSAEFARRRAVKARAAAMYLESRLCESCRMPILDASEATVVNDQLVHEYKCALNAMLQNNKKKSCFDCGSEFTGAGQLCGRCFVSVKL